MYKIAFATLGCKVNQYDTDALIAAFKKEGFDVVDFKEKADVYVVNTCTVTSTGDKKSRQMLRRAVALNPEAIVVATGCYAQGSPDEVEEIDGVDIITGTSSRTKIVDAVKEKLAKSDSKKYVGVSDIRGCSAYEEMSAEGSIERLRAYVKIQDGCDSFCSYCRVPYVRGRVRSRGQDAILKEIAILAEMGIKEVVLTGVHLSLYGKDFGFVPDLSDVLLKIEEIPGIERIRLSSVDPADVTDKLISTIASSKKICKHLHMSLQSGDNDILKRMNRNYTREMYLSIVEKIRQLAPDVTFTTDVIVGFPGEDEEAFLNTMDLVRRVGFSKVHTFKYSKRAGTQAANFESQVSLAEKENRSVRLIALSNELGLISNSAKIGKTDSVLVERVHNSPKNIFELKEIYDEKNIQDVKFAEGVTGDYTRVFFAAPNSIDSGDLVEINVALAYPEFVIGDMKK